jgi:hypothetical protein
MASHRTALLIIRAWVEQDSAEPLRAQVRVTRDVSSGIEQTLAFVQPDEVAQLVDAWLQDVLAGARSSK